MEQLHLFDFIRDRFSITKPIRLIELFAGIGSQAMALRNIGADFEHHRVVEFDRHAIASYNAIHGTEFKTMDITKVHGGDLGIVDKDRFTYLLTYSFPCQDLSCAGNHKGMTKGSGTRSGLLWEVERLLGETEQLPDILLMENVPMVHGLENIHDFKLWIDVLDGYGYSNYIHDLNAKDYGVAQDRERCFMVSILGNYNYHFPAGKPLNKTMKDYLEPFVDEKYYYKTKIAHDLVSKLMSDGHIDQEKNNITVRMSFINGCAIDVCGTITTREGSRGLSYTFKEASHGVIELPEKKLRRLTPRECWRLMGFSDDDYEKASYVASPQQLYKQAGNSIVVSVLEEIFKKLNINQKYFL